MDNQEKELMNHLKRLEYDLVKYKLTSNALGIALWDMEIVGADPSNPKNIISWSREVRDILGFEGEHDFPNILGSLTGRLHPEDAERAFSMFLDHVFDYSGATPFDVEYRLMLKGGGYRYFHAIGTTVRDSDGTPIRVAGALRDIHEIVLLRKAIAEREKNLELRLREKIMDERIKDLFDATPLMIEYWDKNLNSVYCNRTTLEYFGFSSNEEYVVRLKEGLYDTASRERWKNHLKEIFKTGKGRFEFVEQAFGSSEVCLEVEGVCLQYGDDIVVATYSRDITNLKKMEQETALSWKKEREANKMFNALLDASPMFIEIWDSDLNLVDCNNRVTELFGLSKKEEFLERYYDLSPEYQPCGMSSKEKSIICLKRALKDGYGRYEWMHLTADGEELPVEAIFIRLEIEGKVMIVEYNHDLRQIKNAMAEVQRIEIAEESNRAKSRFLARMSHEIRTPISAVMGISEIQLQDPNLSPTIEESFAKIHNSSTVLLSIINDILDLSKIEEGKMQLIQETYNVASMINDVANLHFTHIGSKEIIFELNVDENLPELLIGDILRIKQILNNVLSNAFKYTEDGTVKLTVQRQESEKMPGYIILSVCICDTGMGMTKEQIDALFVSEYTRFHEHENRYIGGTGLGMPIVHSLAKMMDADIQITSKPGEGTVVNISIPQEKVDDQVLGQQVAQSLQQFELAAKLACKKIQFTPEPMPYGKVLVVDDVDTNLYVAKGLLAFYSINAETCESGYEAIAKIKQGNAYDVIFLDHMMPGMDGTETMQTMRDMGYTNPVVALTANAMIGHAEAFLEAGFDGFISKPIDTRRLNKILVRYVKEKHGAYTSKHLPNTNYASDINEFQNSDELIKKMRSDFVRGQKNTFKDLECALKDRDIKTAHLLVHTVKGLAGLIKEPELEKTAECVENRLKKGLVPSDTMLADLGVQLAKTLESIPEPDVPTFESAQDLDRDSARQIFDELEPLLETSNAVCTSFVERLRTIPETAIIVRQIEVFDFEQARDSLKTWRDIFNC